MAKVRGAFGGFGTTQQIGKAYVFFIWKGINAIRTWVIPNNPNTGDQQTQRNNFKALVAYWHGGLLNLLDVAAWERAAGTVKYKPQSGFNRMIGLYRTLFQGVVVPEQIHNMVFTDLTHNAAIFTADEVGHVLGGTDVMQWGTSPTSLWRTETLAVIMGTLVAGAFDTGFGAGTTIYFRFSSYTAVPALYGQTGIYKAVLV